MFFNLTDRFNRLPKIKMSPLSLKEEHIKNLD